MNQNNTLNIVSYNTHRRYMGRYKRYGDYIVDQESNLGSGRNGSVFRGYRLNPQTNSIEAVAIKQSVPDVQNIREIETLQQLQHPHIVKYIDFKLHHNSLFLIMQLCDGTLQDLLASHCHSDSTILSYFSQIISGIGFMYSKRMLHRDLKPSNVLLKGNRIKIADFGTSKVQEEEAIRTMVGTPLFASPELLELNLGQSEEYTEKSDIWSLGLILYAMLHYSREQPKALDRLRASLPWSGNTAIDILKNIRSVPLRIRPTVSLEVREILTRMLTIDVKERMGFEELLKIEIFRGVKEEEMKEIVEEDIDEEVREMLLKGEKRGEDEEEIKDALEWYKVVQYTTAPYLPQEDIVQIKEMLGSKIRMLESIIQKMKEKENKGDETVDKIKQAKNVAEKKEIIKNIIAPDEKFVEVIKNWLIKNKKLWKNNQPNKWELLLSYQCISLMVFNFSWQFRKQSYKQESFFKKYRRFRNNVNIKNIKSRVYSAMQSLKI